MKIELIKEVTEMGETWYFVKKDGSYFDGSATRDIEKAEEIYNKLKAGNKKTEIVLKSREV